MTKEDIIRMAREAGFKHPEAVGQCEDFAYFDLERFAALVAQFERDACAKVCETEWSNVAERMYGEECAAAIRARGLA